MIIGGEHYFTPGQLLRNSKGYIDHLIENFKSDYHINFTFGGYFSLLAIIDAIKPNFNSDSIVLLPSYMCPSILLPFKSKGIEYRFYKVDDELYIDIEYLKSIIDEKVKAVLFIDYFGASQLDRIQPVIDILRLKNIAVIQDVVQCLEINKKFLFGDYIFNSFRKFFPFEGSILLSKEKMNINFSEENNKYVKFKRIGQFLRYAHIKYRLFSSKYFLRYLNKAEHNYHTDSVYRMPKFNLKQLNKFDIDKMSSNQKHYFNLLYENLGNNVPKLLQKNDYVPLGFVIKLNNRDNVRKGLFIQNIFPPIHWILSAEFENKIFEKSIQLSKRILSIPIIGITAEKYKYLSENLLKIIKDESLS
jgi:hypothetical protein